MTGTQSQYQAGEKAARDWLKKNESFYSGMISDELLMSVIKVVVDAIIVTPKANNVSKTT